MNDKTKQEKEFPQTTQTLRRILGINQTSGERLEENDLRRTRGYDDSVSQGSQRNDTYSQRTEQGGKRPARPSGKLLPTGYDRSTHKMGPRRRNSKGGVMVPKRTRKSVRGPVSNTIKTQKQKSFQMRTKLKTQREQYIGVTRRTGYQAPMEMFAPTVVSEGDDSIRMTGSEFLTFIDVETTSSTHSPTQAGDALVMIPFNPLLLSGTRIAQMASLYQLYKYLDVTVEFVPSISSLQNGSLILLNIYDPTDNYTVTTSDKTELMRLALSHEGANMFNIYDYGRCVMVNSNDALKSYFIKEGVNNRQEMQFYFIVLAGSDFVNETPVLTLGSLVVHYHVKFEKRAIIDPISLDENYLFDAVQAEQTNTLFFSAVTANAVIQVDSSGPCFVPAITPRRDMLYIWTLKQDLFDGVSNYWVYDDDGEYQLFRHGSVWFGRFGDESSSSNMQIYSNLEKCIEGNTEQIVRWRDAVTGSATITTGYGYVRGVYINGNV